MGRKSKVDELEIPWKNQICEEFTAVGGVVTKLVAGTRQGSGIPDTVLCHRSCGLWWIEFKHEKTKLTALQRLFIWEHRRRDPCSAVVCRYPDRLEDENGMLLHTFDGTGGDLPGVLSIVRLNTMLKELKNVN